MGRSELNYIDSFTAISCKAGISLRQKYFKEITQALPNLGFVNIDIEDCINKGITISVLEELKEHYKFTFSCKHLLFNINSGITAEKLNKLKVLVNKFNPLNISMQALWSPLQGVGAIGLLPLIYTDKTLNLICKNVSKIQDYLSRQLIIRNPASIFEFKGNMSEPEFLMRVVEKTGCNLALDINNIYTNSVNFNFEARSYIDIISDNIIKEIHLAGHTRVKINGKEKIINSGNNKINKEIWDLYSYTLAEKGYRPTCIDWNEDLSSFNHLLSEVDMCNDILRFYSYRYAA